MIIRKEQGLSFDDVLLAPKLGTLTKRRDADISTRLVGDIRIEVPILSAPMEAVTESRMAVAMRKAGGLGVIHRNMPIEKQVENFVDTQHGTSRSMYPSAVAIGINEGYERWEHLHNAGVMIFVIDVAHGHHEQVEQFMSDAPDHLYGEHTKIIAGNVATVEGVRFLASLGVDGIKVGIGPGAACTTRQVTGFGVPQLTAIMEARKILNERYEGITLIADGGIKNSGDIVKALAAGADSVMLGRLLAGAQETPHPGLYYGMASKRVNAHHAPEGAEGTVPFTGPVEGTIKSLAWGLRSGISYAGATNIQGLQENAEFIKVSSATAIESGVRF